MRHPISTAWLSGSGRSGTTWLGQILTANPGSAFLYEPLHSWLASFPKDLTPAITDAGDRPYFRVGSNNPSWTHYISDVLDGRGFTRRTLLSGIPARQQPRAIWRALTGNRLVIKEIRSNLMIDWLTSTFGVRVILITRHPCAVVASQAARDWGTKRNVLDSLLSQPELVEDHLTGDLHYLNREHLDTELKRLAARWAIENRVALETAQGNNLVLPVAYERLVLNSRLELEKIFDFLNWPIDGGGWCAIERQLNQTGDDQPSPDGRLSRWQSQLDPHQIDDILGVTHSLGIKRYDEGIMPVPPENS